MNTQGAFSYSELMQMTLDEYFTVIEELVILETANRKAELSSGQQAKAALADPAIRKKR